MYKIFIKEYNIDTYIKNKNKVNKILNNHK